MPRHRIVHGHFDGLPTVALEDSHRGTRAVLCTTGATLLSWQHATADGTLELIDGYANAAELRSQAGVRSGIMAPFCNRIADARYRFDGVEHDLQPGVADAGRLIYHGFVRHLELPIVDAQADDAAARVEFACTAIRPGAFAGYPFALDLRIRFSLSGQGIALELDAHNVGDTPAPYSCGWHPYFRLGGDGIEHLSLHLPARHGVATDAGLIPLADHAARQPLQALPALDFRLPRAIDRAVIDGCIADPIADAHGIVHTYLRDPLTGHALEVWQHGGLVHLFTGDTLARDGRRTVAIEPVSAMTDAFNRPDCTAAIRLPPGGSHRFRCGARFGHG